MRIHLRRRKRKLGKRNVLCMIVMILIVSTILLIRYANVRIMPVLADLSEMEAKRFSTELVNNALETVLSNDANMKEIFEVTKDDDSKIQMLDFNPVVVNNILNSVNGSILDAINQFENDGLGGNYDGKFKRVAGTIAKIPLGTVLKSGLLGGVGPMIPIKIHYKGDVKSNIKTKLTPYGINNALLEVSISIEMTAQVIVPFLERQIKINNSIPIAIKIVQGGIPNYYGSGLMKDSSLYSIPLE